MFNIVSKMLKKPPFMLIAAGIRMAGLMVQAGVLLLLAEEMPAAALAQYFEILAVGMVLAAAGHMGYARYAYRLVHRGAGLDKIMTRLLQILAVGTLAGGVAILCYSRWQDVPPEYGLLVLLAMAVSQMSELNRFIVSHQGDMVRLAVMDSTQYAVYGGLLLLARGAGVLTVPVFYDLFFLSFVVAFVVSSHRAGLMADWRKSLSAMWYDRRRDRRNGKTGGLGLRRQMRRAAPVGIENLLTLVQGNVPVMLAATVSTPAVVVLAGIFQRLIQVAMGIINLSLMHQVRAFYDQRSRARLDPAVLARLAGMACLVTGAVMLLFQMLRGVLWLWPTASEQVALLVYLRALLPVSVWVSLAVGLNYLLWHLSFAALGKNRARLRVVCTALVIGVMVVWSAACPTKDMHALVTGYVFAFAAGCSLYSWCMLHPTRRRV